jgi:hypothetical protein
MSNILPFGGKAFYFRGINHALSVCYGDYIMVIQLLEYDYHVISHLFALRANRPDYVRSIFPFCFAAYPQKEDDRPAHLTLERFSLTSQLRAILGFPSRIFHQISMKCARDWLQPEQRPNWSECPHTPL